jgi:hypothetical protein
MIASSCGKTGFHNLGVTQKRAVAVRYGGR